MAALVPVGLCVLHHSGVFDVASFGAVGDGVANDTEAVRAAAAAVHAAGGGELLFGPGSWRTGGFRLSSNSVIRIEGTVIGISPASPYSAQYDYPIVASPPSYPDDLMHSALLYGRGISNVTITGGGIIWGGGDVWWNWAGYSFNRTGGLLCSDSENCSNVPNAMCQGNTCKAPTAAGLVACRPHTVHLWGAEDVLLTNVTIMRSAYWTVRLTYCSRVLVEAVRIITNDTATGSTGQPPALYQPANTDGLDIDSTMNITIRDSYFATHDDSIALKSGKDSWGRGVNRPTANVWVENCRAHSFVGAAFAVGSEMSGGIHNVSIRNFHVDKTELGLSIKTERGRGSVVEDVHFQSIRMHDTACAAIQLNMMYHTGIPPGNASTTPELRGITFDNVVASNIGGHAGFCMPLGAEISKPSGSSLSEPPATGLSGQQPFALFVGLPESKLRAIDLNRVELSGLLPIASAVQCVDAKITNRELQIDGKVIQHIHCGKA